MTHKQIYKDRKIEHNMVKILSDRKHNYALDCGDCIVYWSKPGDHLVMDWCADSGTYVLRVQAGEFTNDKEELEALDKTEHFLKNFINKTHNTLPITPVDDDDNSEFFYNDREYTDIKTNDACRVPCYEWTYANFTIDGDKDGTMQLYFQNNGTPWFCGDSYDMPDDAWMQIASKDWDAEFIAKFSEIPEGSAELADFYSSFVDKMLASIQHRREAIEDKHKKNAAKKKAAKAHVEEELKKLDVHDNTFREVVEKFAADNKLDITKVVNFANELTRASK